MGDDNAKRTFDVLIGMLLLVLALPVILIGAVGTAISLRAWPFFSQQRIGRDGQPFRFFKLRTLPVEAPRYAGKYEITHLELPAFSRFLRRHHLDELPQILLVVTGHMSLVGPRPEMPHLHAQLEPQVAARRTSIRPGCTGLWQVGEHCDAMIHQHPEFDDHYLEHRSVRLDLWILARTARLLLPLSSHGLVALGDLPPWAGGRVVQPAMVPAIGMDAHAASSGAGGGDLHANEGWAAEPRLG